MKQSDVCQSQKDQKNVALIIQAQKGMNRQRMPCLIECRVNWSVVRKFGTEATIGGSF